MKSMTDHIGKHYDGLRPSVNKKNATSLPIQPLLSAPQFQRSPPAASLRTKSLKVTPPKPSPWLPLQPRDPSKGMLSTGSSLPSKLLSLSPPLSAQPQTPQVSLRPDSSVSPTAFSASLQPYTRPHGNQSGARGTSTPLRLSPRLSRQTQPCPDSVTSTTTLPPTHSISPPGTQDQEPDDNSKSGINSLFSAEFSTPKSDNNESGMNSLFSAEFSSPESNPSSPTRKPPLYQPRIGPPSNVNSEILSPLAYAPSDSIFSHPENKVSTFSL